MNNPSQDSVTSESWKMLEERYADNTETLCKIAAALHLDDDAKGGVEEYARFIHSNKNNSGSLGLVAISRDQCNMLIVQAEKNFDKLAKNPR